jgi:hypothetical protein
MKIYLFSPIERIQYSEEQLFYHKYTQALWEGGSVGTSIRGPESQEGACESLKGPIALAIDVLFRFFHHVFSGIFNYF